MTIDALSLSASPRACLLSSELSQLRDDNEEESRRLKNRSDEHKLGDLEAKKQNARSLDNTARTS